MPDQHHAGHHPEPESYAALRTRAIESLLVEKGLISSEGIDLIVQKFEQDIGPLNGAKVVARAWVDSDFKRRLLEDGTRTIAELGYTASQGSEIRVLENTPAVHNVVVCTLCSCYPWAVLGLPPTWYKSAPYRSRVVREPRAVLREFGTELAADVTIQVWDSTAELRYLVLPERPAGTAELNEEELAALVSRDSMIGVVKLAAPGVRALTMSAELNPDVSAMDGEASLPRQNGELVFEAPWEGRAFGIAVALNEQAIYPWGSFRDALVERIALDEAAAADTSYYERWLSSLEALILQQGLVTQQELDARTAEYASGARDDDWDQDHH